MQEIEAAAAIGGLAMNPSKSEAMGCRIKTEVVSEVAANPVKERVRLGKESEGRRGWMAPAKWREELGIENEQMKKRRERWRSRWMMRRNC